VVDPLIRHAVVFDGQSAVVVAETVHVAVDIGVAILRSEPLESVARARLCVLLSPARPAQRRNSPIRSHGEEEHCDGFVGFQFSASVEQIIGEVVSMICCDGWNTNVDQIDRVPNPFIPVHESSLVVE